MAVSRFSLSAYHDLRDAGELSRQERLVFETVAAYGPMTREEVETKTGMRLGSVCGRVNSLLLKGVFIEIGEKKNPTTGKLNGLIDLSLAEASAKTLPTMADSAEIAQRAIEFAQRA